MRREGLAPFLDAQAPVIDRAMAELARGRKETHWMWFVFPQLRGLGRSERARFYGIEGLEEARDYAAHPVLAPRLRAAAELVLSHAGRPAEAIMGAVDAAKLRSCATLFAAADPAARVFSALLCALYEGTPCPETAAQV
ncbi:MAG: DUF1810 domain-containing protein [Paracoccaceae bacterium]|jgi:uncharacterized protein (DUF1810 family)|nr:DUF1810 domain-containing protein [Paracoccaceae bacterium]